MNFNRQIGVIMRDEERKMRRESDSVDSHTPTRDGGIITPPTSYPEKQEPHTKTFGFFTKRTGSDKRTDSGKKRNKRAWRSFEDWRRDR